MQNLLVVYMQAKHTFTKICYLMIEYSMSGISFNFILNWVFIYTGNQPTSSRKSKVMKFATQLGNNLCSSQKMKSVAFLVHLTLVTFYFSHFTFYFLHLTFDFWHLTFDFHLLLFTFYFLLINFYLFTILLFYLLIFILNF